MSTRLPALGGKLGITISNSRLEVYDNYQWDQHLRKERRKQPSWHKLNHPPGWENIPIASTDTLQELEKEYVTGYAGHLRGVRSEALFGRCCAPTHAPMFGV
jgi:hypothetical protein